jgi:hypothetical protein
MELSSVDRISALRPKASEVAAPVAAKVVPVAPVNSSGSASAAQISPKQTGVINDIDPKLQAQVSAQAKQVDPMTGGPKANENLRNWTKRLEEVGKVEDPPKEPISKMLMQHILSVWKAGAKAVDIMTLSNQHATHNMVQAQRLADVKNEDTVTAPGKLTKETLTYSPSQIKRNEKSDPADV